jgi:hypothetical protein
MAPITLFICSIILKRFELGQGSFLKSNGYFDPISVELCAERFDIL